MKWAIEGAEEKTGKPMHLELDAASADAAKAQGILAGKAVEMSFGFCQQSCLLVRKGRVIVPPRHLKGTVRNASVSRRLRLP